MPSWPVPPTGLQTSLRPVKIQINNKRQNNSEIEENKRSCWPFCWMEWLSSICYCMIFPYATLHISFFLCFWPFAIFCHATFLHERCVVSNGHRPCVNISVVPIFWFQSIELFGGFLLWLTMLLWWHLSIVWTTDIQINIKLKHSVD